jgi:dihydrofolate reductase
MSIPIALVAGIGRHNRSIGKAGELLRNVPDVKRTR